MRFYKGFLIGIIIIGLCIPYSLAEKKESSHESKGSHAKGSSSEHKGSGEEIMATENITVTGRVHFADYYSMGGKKCSAFVEAEDGTLFCVTDSVAVDTLKAELGGVSALAKLFGTIKETSKGRYLEVEKYETNTYRKSSGEVKGSGSEDKGSH